MYMDKHCNFSVDGGNECMPIPVQAPSIMRWQSLPEGARISRKHCSFSVQVRNEYEADKPVPLVDAKIAVLR
jgi:hypothetical protein